MRADRLLSIMLLLQANSRMTAGDLAVRLEVSERTIHRDMDALSTAGIPVISERGNNGGWSLLEGYRANLHALNPEEMKTLFLQQPLFADLGLAQTAEQALLKLLASIPAEHRAQAEAMQQRLYIDPTAWRQSKEELSWLSVVQDAVWGDHKLLLAYQRQDKKIVERLVNPLGLVAKGSTWYLIASIDDSIRTYRVSRISSAMITEEPAIRPPDFNLQTYWQQSTADFIAALPEYSVTLRVSPHIFSRLRYAGTFVKIDSVALPAEDGWRTVKLHFDIKAEAREFVLGFGTFVTVIEPKELIDEVVNMAKSVIAQYENSPS